MLKSKRSSRSGLGSAIWQGVLLGFLLTLFMAVLVYAAYLFLALGRQAVADIPAQPPLALPQLVRPAARAEEQRSSAAALPQPAARRAQEAPPLLSERVTVLVMGVDSRPGETAARTDTIMLVTVNPQTGTSGMMSIPRDLLIRSSALGQTVKINTLHVFGEIYKFPGGGPALLREAVEELTGYPVDYYVRINFDGFRQIVDLLGGVDIDVPREIKDDLYPDENYGYEPLYIPAGRQHMDGALALKYARTRHGDSDFQRAERQQQLLLALKEKVTQPGQMAALLPRIPGLAVALANSIQTDMPIDKAIALARSLDQVDLKNPVRVVVDHTMGQSSTDERWGYVLIPNVAQIKAAADSVFADAPVGSSAAESAQQALQAEGARIIVLNGTAEPDVAAKTAARLIADGFRVVNLGNAERADYAETWLISYGDTKPITREALARRFSIPPDRVRSEPPSDTLDLTLIIGRDQAPMAAGR